MAAKSKIDLAAAGIDAVSVVEGWRDSHPKVAGRARDVFLSEKEVARMLGMQDDPAIRTWTARTLCWLTREYGQVPIGRRVIGWPDAKRESGWSPADVVRGRAMTAALGWTEALLNARWPQGAELAEWVRADWLGVVRDAPATFDWTSALALTYQTKYVGKPRGWDLPPGTQPMVLRGGGLWKAYERAARTAVQLGYDGYEAGKCRFAMQARHLVVTLPSSRDLVYRDARIEDVPNRYSGKLRASVTYTNPRGTREVLYGGLIAENITQAACRDLLGEALVRFEREAPGEVVLHVHDEIVSEVDEATAEADLEIMRGIAAEPPEWAAGLPLATSGAVGKRWAK